MGREIERKFLVLRDLWHPDPAGGVRYRQGYLSTDPDRVRLTLLMVSLIPAETLTELKTRLGSYFSGLSPQGLQALATAHLEGFVTNERLQQLLDEHPADITFLLTKFCEKGLLVSDGRRRWTRYRLPWAATTKTGEATVNADKGSGSSPKGLAISPKPSDSSPKGLAISPKPFDSSLKGSDSPLKEADPEAWDKLRKIAEPVYLTKRTNPDKIRQVILELCSDQFLTPGELAEHTQPLVPLQRLLVVRQPTGHVVHRPDQIG